MYLFFTNKSSLWILEHCNGGATLAHVLSFNFLNVRVMSLKVYICGNWSVCRSYLFFGKMMNKMCFTLNFTRTHFWGHKLGSFSNHFLKNETFQSKILGIIWILWVILFLKMYTFIDIADAVMLLHLWHKTRVASPANKSTNKISSNQCSV